MLTIRNKIRSIQKQLSLIVWLRGMTVCLVLLLGALLILSGIDWAVRLESTSIRWILSLCFWGTLAGCLFWLIRELRKRPSLSMTALMLERIDPSWHGELAAVVSFQEQNSADPFRHVELLSNIAQRVETRLQTGVLTGISKWKFVFWPVILFTLLTSLTCLAAAFPAETYLASSRVLWPQRSLNWPRRTNLRVLDISLQPVVTQQILVHGSRPAEFLIHDTVGDPPNRVLLEIQKKDNKTKLTQLNSERRTDSSTGKTITVFPVSLKPQTGTVRFRVVADDDQQMEWYTVTQVTPMFLTDWNMTVTSPDYLDLPSQVIDHQVGELSFVTGSQFIIQGSTDRPFQQLHLEYGDDQYELAGTRSDFRFEIAVLNGESKLLLRGAPMMEDVLADAFQSEPLKQLQIAGIKDEPPVIKRASSQLHYQFTIDATPVFQFDVLDDFGLAAFEVRGVSTDQEQILDQQTIDSSHKTQINFQTPLSLASLQQTLGSEFEIIARAKDRQPVTDWVEAVPIHIEIVSKEAKLQDLHQSLGDITEMLRDANAQQQRLMEQSTDLSIQYRETNRLRPEDLIRLRTVADGQTRIQQTFSDESPGVIMRLKSLQSELEENGLNNSPLHAQMIQIITQIEASLVPSAHLASVEVNTMVRLGPSLLEETDGVKLIADPHLTFVSLSSAQQQIILQLNSILERLQIERAQAEFQQDWNRIADEFRKLVQSTTVLAQSTISLSENALSPQNRADLAQHSEQHRRLSEKVNAFTTTAHENTPSVEMIARMLSEGNTSDDLKQVAEDLRKNNVSHAMETDFRLLRLFQEIDKQLGQLHTSNALSQLSDLQEVVKLLEQVQSSETDLREQFLLSDLNDPMLRGEFGRKQSVQTQNFELLSSVAILQAYLNVIHTTVINMQLLEQALVNSPVDRVEALFTEIDTSLETLLSKYRQSLQQVEQQAQAEGRAEAGRIAQELSLQQQQLRNETLAFNEEEIKTGRLTREQRRQLIELRDREQRLLNRVNEMYAEMQEAKIFRLALVQVEQNLNRVISFLSNQQTSAEVTQRQLQVSTELQDLAESLLQSELPTHGATSNATSSQSALLPGELALLIRLQERIIQREEALLAIPQKNRDDRELQEIARDQQLIGGVIRELLTTQPTPTTNKP